MFHFHEFGNETTTWAHIIAMKLIGGYKIMF